MSTLPPPPSPLDWAVNTDKLTATRTSLIEAQNAVHAATANPTKFRKKAKEFTAKILSPAKAVVDILEALGGFHPAIKAVAGVLKGVIQLEETRGDIDRRIAAFFPEIVSLLLLYTKLGPVFNDEREHRLQLDDQLGKVTESIIKFGSFSENYYKRKRKLLHFVLFAAGLKQELDDLLKAFIQLTQGINTLVLHKSALTVTTVAYNMVTGADLEEEFRKFKDAIHKEDDRERQAALAVAAAGGLNAALKDPESIAQFTEAFGKQVTPSIRKAFTEDMKKILKKDG
ncbi:hypothetical protein D9615_008221 [Tricholomella constricta]|uniref:Uncharacterized protein n=1 Tax=Tricholomella constricta TaxID=117010 RepID=A0A8H5H3T8_9AGAR|nr:hypothetical protein D9615_008221 [Tricholomella constricta]